MTNMNRRGFLLRGAFAGATVGVGLPFLDYFLDDNGTAFAAEYGGGRLPVRFGTWFWGCGMIPDRWNPKKQGPVMICRPNWRRSRLCRTR